MNLAALCITPTARLCALYVIPVMCVCILLYNVDIYWLKWAHPLTVRFCMRDKSCQYTTRGSFHFTLWEEKTKCFCKNVFTLYNMYSSATRVVRRCRARRVARNYTFLHELSYIAMDEIYRALPCDATRAHITNWTKILMRNSHSS